MPQTIVQQLAANFPPAWTAGREIMDELGRPRAVFGDHDVVSRAGAVRAARFRWLLARCSRLIEWLGSGGKRRQLTELSDRQLHDAGIDLSRAGRGKAAAVRLHPGVTGLQ